MTAITEILDKHHEAINALDPTPSLWDADFALRQQLKLLESIRADIAKLKVWTLKPLVWELSGCDWIARWGTWWFRLTNVQEGEWIFILNGWDQGKYESLDQAKSAAQEHYNSKMKEGLLPA